jgi:flagellar biosynthetic protein FliQ
MSPETAINELGIGLKLALTIGLPLLLSVLLVGVVIGVIQAATQINEQTIAFVAKAITLAAVLSFAGSWLLSELVDYTTALIQRIPSLVG